MRVPDLAGDLSVTVPMPDATAPDAAAPDAATPAASAPERADPAKGKPATHRLALEGRDDDGDGRWNEDGPGGVDLSRNFTWRFEEHVPLAGGWPASESETRAVLDLLLADERVAMVYELGDAETIVKSPAWGGAWTQLPDPDLALYDGLRELHGKGPELPREPRAPAPGGLGVATLHHLGRIWLGRAPLGRQGPPWPAAGAPWPAHLLVRWRAVTAAGLPPGTELGDVELAPEKTALEISTEAESIAAFLLECARSRARLEFAKTETSGDAGVLRISTRLVHRGRLPTHTARGAEVRGRRPINVRVRLPEGATLVGGRPLVQIERLANGAESEPLVYVVRGASGAVVTVEARGPDTGNVVLEARIP